MQTEIDLCLFLEPNRKRTNTLGLHDAEFETVLKQCLNHSAPHKEALYKGYYGYIKGVVKRYVSDHHVGEELVNDSFIKIFNNLTTFKSPLHVTNVQQSFKSWVAKITSRTTIDFLRKKKIDFSKDEPTEHRMAEGYITGSYSNDAKEILLLLNKLPEVQKTVFNLYEIEGFSHEEIANMLGISEAVCRVYLSRAKIKLKALYLKHF